MTIQDESPHDVPYESPHDVPSYLQQSLARHTRVLGGRGGILSGSRLGGSGWEVLGGDWGGREVQSHLQ